MNAMRFSLKLRRWRRVNAAWRVFFSGLIVLSSIALADPEADPKADVTAAHLTTEFSAHTALQEEVRRLGSATSPPSTGLSPALQSAGTPFEQHRFKLSLAENDVFFSDKGLSQFLEALYTYPLNDALALNTALKSEMVTPVQRTYLSAEGTEQCCVSPGIYHYPLYLETQLVGSVPVTSRLNVRLAGHVRAGIDAPEEIGGPLQNAWHDLIGSPRFDVTGEAEFYGGVGGSALLEGKAGSFSGFAGPSLHFTTLQRSVGVTGGMRYDIAPFALQFYASAERVSSRYFTDNFETGRRIMPGVSASLNLSELGLGERAPSLGFSILYDYNTVAPNLSNVRYTFIPDIQLSIPVE